jgi:broad specificity phosphatase PhoE
MKIILIRHGKPDIHKGRWISRRGFAAYIDQYERAGLDKASHPPQTTRDLTKGITTVFCSDRPRSVESAGRLLPDAQRVSDPVFMEAQLTSPVLPLMRMHAAGWSILARLAWHAGHHRGVETWRECKRRALTGMHMLWREAEANGTAVLVAHGYINMMIGIRLRQRGWTRTGKHRAEYWNTVVYEKRDAGPLPQSPPPT